MANNHPQRVGRFRTLLSALLGMRATMAKLIMAWRLSNRDQCPLLAAGIAFYAFLALFPALLAFEFLFGLVADPAELTRQITTVTGTLPAVARELIADQLAAMADAPRPVLSIGLVIAVLAELWSVSGVIDNLFGAVNTAYRVPEDRGLVQRKLRSVIAALVTIGYLAVIVALVIIAPQQLDRFAGPVVVGGMLEALRWLVLMVLIISAVRWIYRVAPNRRFTRPRLFSPGAIAATLIWLVASAGFSVYVAVLGSHVQTYGAMAGVAVLLLWLWLAGYAVLLGAEINSQLEPARLMSEPVDEVSRG